MRAAPGLGVEAKVRRAQSAALISLSGVIDETFDPLCLIPNDAREVVLDLEGVRRITSFGVRQWVEGLRLLAPAYLGFTACRPAIVSQLNMVAGFASGGQVLSFYVPFLCPSCGKDFEALCDLLGPSGASLATQLPEATCSECKVAAEFDDVPESYLAFVRGQPRPTVPPQVRGMLGLEGTGVVHVAKEIRGTVTALWITGPLDVRARFGRMTDGLEGDVVAIMDGVTTATRDSLDAFLQAATASGAQRVFLCRLSRPVVMALAERPLAQGTEVVSAQVQIVCASCNAHGTVEIVSHAAMLTRGIHVCPACGARADLEGDDQGSLLKVAFTSAPVEVARYLAEHPRGPTAVAPAAEDGEGATDLDGATFGRYQIVKRIGSGGMAEILLAKQKGPDDFDRLVALKRIHNHLSQRTSFLQMFVTEARLSARLSHPNIVAIYDVGKVGTRHYIAMEYVRGWDLATVLRWSGALDRKMPISLAIKIVLDVCEGLNAAHEYRDEAGQPQPIIHRDVSPANVLLSDSGFIKLSDFGIAKAADTVDITESGVVKGKLPYLAPERLQRNGVVDSRQDIFAAGIILFEVLTGTQLFRRASQEGTIDAVLRADVPLPSSVRADAAPFDAICLRALMRDVDRRYPTARELQLALNTRTAALGLTATASELASWLRTLAADAQGSGFTDEAWEATRLDQSEPTREIPLAPADATTQAKS